MSDLTTISAEEFEDLLENIVHESKPYNIVLQPILFIVQAAEPGQMAWMGEGSVLVTGIFSDERIEVVGYKLRSVDPANVEQENRRFIDRLELLLDITGVHNVPGLSVTVKNVRNPS